MAGNEETKSNGERPPGTMRNAATAVDTITATSAGIRLSARCATNLTIHSEEEMRREELTDTHQENE